MSWLQYIKQVLSVGLRPLKTRHRNVTDALRDLDFTTDPYESGPRPTLLAHGQPTLYRVENRWENSTE